MRVLCTAVPGSGLFLPTVPLAWALRAAGHEVLLLNNGVGARAAAGAGLSTMDVEVLSQVLEQAKFRETAADVRDEIAWQPSPAEVVGRLAKLV